MTIYLFIVNKKAPIKIGAFYCNSTLLQQIMNTNHAIFLDEQVN
jgi:hypothetical protein